MPILITAYSVIFSSSSAACRGTRQPTRMKRRLQLASPAKCIIPFSMRFMDVSPLCQFAPKTLFALLLKRNAVTVSVVRYPRYLDT